MTRDFFKFEQSLTHLDEEGEARMVDVSAKVPTVRQAEAGGQVRMSRETFEVIQAGNAPKGDVLGTAKLAGIMAAKQTAQLIPLCHPLPLQKIDVRLIADPQLPGYQIRAMVKTKAETGVEMEALTAVSIAALTLYDMAKGLEKSICIELIRLLSKSGGKSGDYSATRKSEVSRGEWHSPVQKSEVIPD
ncbi:cyclic pyranopterin monophosphate synthase MoaC [Okeania sp. SIO2B3]|uniref:cyclic pyranopterin monophosphate synthase MoaC n=1 Tax=Okeania sp. SIO2B3 TaxID=2607784 RepID=UPI0013BF4B66|nr:cyclic pyranopterin monophosphate synthase MoaC [Okeania sp. SIO2B3]NET40536.1 cyclic pyranopterin monophosphate synthase MoaC [Okeania sp. SIO2B3]